MLVTARSLVFELLEVEAGLRCGHEHRRLSRIAQDAPQAALLGGRAKARVVAEHRGGQALVELRLGLSDHRRPRVENEPAGA